MSLNIFDSSGRLVFSVEEGQKKSGYHTIQMNVISLNSGIYYYQLQVDDVLQVRKMIFMK